MDGRRAGLNWGEEDQHRPFAPSPSPSPSTSSAVQLGIEEAAAVVAKEASAGVVVEKEHMFDKVVTPSDVGKLNRLVIPKQHAEKYFPLDAAGNEKGLLLSFEDRTGKPWRFRYSYWNSSQSYVMTKGWSRFVKEKRLDAGDTVSFGRGVGDSARDRLFIDWKRRPDAPVPPRLPLPSSAAAAHNSFLSFTRSAPWGGRLFVPPPLPPSAFTYNAAGTSSASSSGGQYVFFRPPTTSAVQYVAGSSNVPIVLDSVPVVPHSNKAMGKRVRLFGVNLDCPESSDSDDDARPGPPLQLRLGWEPDSSEREQKQ